MDTRPGELPEAMAAWVIRQEREAEPTDAFQLEQIEVPEPGAFEVIVRVMAAGVNFNNVWAALGKPVSVFGSATIPPTATFGGSDAAGIVWKVGEGVTRWQPGDEVVMHTAQVSYEDVEVHGLDPTVAPTALPGATRRPGAPSPSSPRCRPSSCCPAPRASPGRRPPLRPRLLHRLPHAARPVQAAGWPQRLDLGRRRRSRRLRGAALQGRRCQRGRRRLLGGEGRAGRPARRRGFYVDRNEFGE